MASCSKRVSSSSGGKSTISEGGSSRIPASEESPTASKHSRHPRSRGGVLDEPIVIDDDTELSLDEDTPPPKRRQIRQRSSVPATMPLHPMVEIPALQLTAAERGEYVRFNDENSESESAGSDHDSDQAEPEADHEEYEIEDESEELIPRLKRPRIRDKALTPPLSPVYESLDTAPPTRLDKGKGKARDYTNCQTAPLSPVRSRAGSSMRRSLEIGNEGPSARRRGVFDSDHDDDIPSPSPSWLRAKNSSGRSRATLPTPSSQDPDEIYPPLKTPVKPKRKPSRPSMTRIVDPAFMHEQEDEDDSILFEPIPGNPLRIGSSALTPKRMLQANGSKPSDCPGPKPPPPSPSEELFAPSENTCQICYALHIEATYSYDPCNHRTCKWCWYGAWEISQIQSTDPNEYADVCCGVCSVVVDELVVLGKGERWILAGEILRPKVTYSLGGRRRYKWNPYGDWEPVSSQT
ncbi:hypothetical protein FN846DRAFT_670478 [Sphaerosporella brunnea]|uniref:RING-type domain-containing protein n=1 Tax=Sphaerosporella brunnea TaxID=1250544 RepID=A0A5J5F9T4_9PEZI|nr:hypothetical protein FN846DRAFT_670478 [Sphaerosporella brunnea]